MHAALRALLLALGPLLAASSVRAQPAELPPIFAPRGASESPAASAVNRVPLPLSDRARTMMNVAAGSVLKEVRRLEPSESRVSPTYSMLETGDTVLMSRYVVKSERAPQLDLRKSDSPLMDFLKTGTLYRKIHGKAEFRIDLRILPFAQTGRNGEWGFAMPQIGFGLSW